MIDFDMLHDNAHDSSLVRIKIVGIGGAGGNTVNSMIDADIEGVEFIVANSDMQALRQSKAVLKIQLGMKTTKGLGCGANPEVGRRAAQEDIDRIMDIIGDADIVFIVAGMGGGTGSGGAPVIAKALKEKGILSVAVVTKPFSFEGKRRQAVAQESLEALKAEVDTLIVVPNEKLLHLVDRSVSMLDAFNLINKILIQSVRSISSIISRSGHINVDFADLKTIMKGMGLAMMGTGTATGPDRAIEAARKAITSELLENADIKTARGILLNVAASSSLSLHEINDAAAVLYDESNKDAHIIVGSVVDESLGDELVVSFVATGFESESKKVVAPVQASLPDDGVIMFDQDDSLQNSLNESEQNVTVLENKAPSATDVDVPAYLRANIIIEHDIK